MTKFNKNLRTAFLSFSMLLVLLMFHKTAESSGANNSKDPIFEETLLTFIGEDLYTVSIASRKAEPLQRAPAAVTIIQDEELKSYRTLSEALRRVPG